ncbi:MAG: hypothetical protein IMZ54_07810 [Acidobacteria bacterium]|nr:hypothetical protein [Acidobacteriota bacterium]
MPTIIFLRGGVKFQLKGDGPGTVIKRLFRPMAVGIAMNGHLVEFRWRDRIFIDPQPEAEFQELLAAQAKQQADQEKAQKDAQAKAEKDKDAAIAKAADAFILKYGPDKANWPESLRPKAPAPDASQN